MIINLNQGFDREKFEKYKQSKKDSQKQNYCSHDKGFTFDGEVDEVICDNCRKKWTAFEFMWYWVESKENLKYKVFQIENAIHFLSEDKLKLEEEIKLLKSEKRKLKLEINKLNKQDYKQKHPQLRGCSQINTSHLLGLKISEVVFYYFAIWVMR